MHFNCSNVSVCMKGLIRLHFILQVFERLSEIQQPTGPYSTTGSLSFSQREALVRGIYKSNKTFPSETDIEHTLFLTDTDCLPANTKFLLPLSLFRKLKTLITCGRRLPYFASRCPCPCFVCMLAS